METGSNPDLRFMAQSPFRSSTRKIRGRPEFHLIMDERMMGLENLANLNKRSQPLVQEKLKIAMFTNNYFPFIGGVPISIRRLAKGLRDAGHEVYIFAPKYPGDNQDKDDFIIRCKLLIYHRTKIFDFPIVHLFAPEIDKAFADHHFDVIHVHHPFWMGSKGLYLGRKHRIPVVFTYHTRLDHYYHYLPVGKRLFKNILSHKMVKRFAQKCNAVIAPTASAKDYLCAIGVSKETVILPTGISVGHEESNGSNNAEEIKAAYSHPSEILMCCVCRLSKEKNITFLIEALHFVKKKTSTPFSCLIIGDGPEKRRLIESIENYGLQDTVKLVGSIKPEEISAYYQAADLFVYSSKSETQGMVLLEAMANRCPVVAISSNGVDDVIRNGFNGYKTEEAVDKWAGKVVGLLENQDELRAMSHNAYQFAEKFSVETIAEKAAGIYHKVIKENSSKRA